MPHMIHFCSFTEDVREWQYTLPIKDVLVWFAGGMPNASLDFIQQCYRESADHIESFCGLRFDFTDDQTKAHHLIVPTQLDGPSGVLADQQMQPQPKWSKPLRMRLDFERWGPQLPLTEVLKHETGHFCGLGHETAELALMNPTLNTSISGFQPHEQEWFRAKFGPPRPRRAEPNPVPVPTPIPAPSPTGEPDLVLTIGDHKYRVPLVKVS